MVSWFGSFCGIVVGWGLEVGVWFGLVFVRIGSRRYSYIGCVVLFSGGFSWSFIEFGCVFSYGNIVEFGDVGIFDSVFGFGFVVECGGVVGKV